MSKRPFSYYYDDGSRSRSSSPYPAAIPPNDAELTLSLTGPHSKPTVAYFFNEEVSAFHYGEGHPMKPARLALTHNLVMAYGLDKKMLNFRPRAATDDEIAVFHEDDYIEFLKRVNPGNLQHYSSIMGKFNIGVEDCPVFDGMFDFCRIYTGASLEAARKLVSGVSDVAVNWSGGLHHAKKWEASGFCYVNDIVLAILELLRAFPRVLYVDIDVHHGDGVQEAFYMSNRVMTASFHRYDGHFFPGSGSIEEKGTGKGKYYAINVPLAEYIDDDAYAYVFRNVMTDIMSMFRPSVVVLQCGADSLASDRLGCFNLSIRGHGQCVRFMKSFNVPMLCLGGGGYTVRNVARAWTYETSVLTDTDLTNDLPNNPYMSYYGPDYKLHAPIVDSSAENANSRPITGQHSGKGARVLAVCGACTQCANARDPLGCRKVV
ncbi:uncharacterized protein SPPG_04238 [Spizellomyces punctatus DAOM BR117]|uniref:Histone deacetylase n=1 Tax=Spizellomyces punctatus (strain DAOM BR117) TaxID=645134 RepID=A0A0L0HI85_SPIPD|nr:uncharacterized protein SPPG_04238 [Spizellomyces punctatus DAOM BR117]KND01146.1 hypothetical protein SPPG_04238 [Spizellomyces punctatus DAOM BR117]|eukprot:XP_016609185.1 hypothetical protein SPPG_04238 [Spizellomyces punctatus DAOM BR117]